VTDDATWYALMEQAQHDPSAFLKQDLLNYRHKLSEQDGQAMQRLKLSLSGGDGGAAAQQALAGFRTHNQIVQDTLWQYTRTKETDYTPRQLDAKANLMRMVDQWTAEEQAGGRKVTNLQIQERLDQILGVKATIPGSWWALFQPFTYDLADKPGRFAIELTYDDIPVDERTQLEAVLKSNRRVATPQTILDLYLSIKTQPGAR
jgi:hypothetical protein